MSAFGDKDIRGFNVAVHDSRRVRSLQRIRDLGGHRQQNVQFHRTPRNAMLERHAVQKLHGNKSQAILFANVVDRTDVRVVQR
jgi:hypothetical protein